MHNDDDPRALATLACSQMIDQWLEYEPSRSGRQRAGAHTGRAPWCTISGRQLNRRYSIITKARQSERTNGERDSAEGAVRWVTNTYEAQLNSPRRNTRGLQKGRLSLELPASAKPVFGEWNSPVWKAKNTVKLQVGDPRPAIKLSAAVISWTNRTWFES